MRVKGKGKGGGDSSRSLAVPDREGVAVPESTCNPVSFLA